MSESTHNDSGVKPSSHSGAAKRQVMELFRKVAHEQNAGVIVVTHDHRALDVFDRTIEMEDGRLREAHQSFVVDSGGKMPPPEAIQTKLKG